MECRLGIPLPGRPLRLALAERDLHRDYASFRVDLFASRHNTQLKSFYSFYPDLDALGVDALAHNWSPLTRYYAFPPFILIGRVLHKLIQDQVKSIVLIAPIWPTRPWYSQLLLQTVDLPVRLPQDFSVLTNPLGEPHPLMVEGRLPLAAWNVSGIQKDIAVFQMRRSESLLHPGARAREKPTHPCGVNGSSAGVVQGREIPFFLQI